MPHDTPARAHASTALATARAANAPTPAEAVAAVEQRLTELTEALQRRDGPAAAICANEVHRSLAIALRSLSTAAGDGGTAALVVAGLRPRLVAARAHLLVQRDAIARGGASLQRALDVLFERGDAPALYGVQGQADRRRSTGSVQA